MKILQLVAGIILILHSHALYGTHLRSVEIKSRVVDCGTFTYEIVITAYVNTNSLTRFGGDKSLLAFGDGVNQSLPELTPQVIDPLLNIGKIEFSVIHQYPGPGNYKLQYSEYNRNEGIQNMSMSGSTPLTTETYLGIEPDYCNSSPFLAVAPVDRACKGVAFYHNPGTVDLDDDSLSYEIVIPKGHLGNPVEGYLSPINISFYLDNYNLGNENKDGPPTLSINSIDGTLTWNAPGIIGEFAIAIMITEWRLNPLDSTRYMIGYTIRDMQIIVEECLNQKPDLSTPENYCVMAGSTIQFTSLASDPDNDNVVIEVFSDIFSLNEYPAMIPAENGKIQSTNPPNDTATLTFTWNTTCAHVKAQPYQLTLKITDQPPSGPRLVRFKTVHIKVIAPAPQHQSIAVNPVTKQVVLHWSNYPCNNVKTFQIWRRVSNYNYDQPICNNGMPSFLQYQLIDEVAGDQSSYTDNDLSIGAQYCYRLVALVGDSKIPSKISLDTCIIPKPAEAPVITNVSVSKTDLVSGEIKIVWTTPFDIDSIQYPPPYLYKIYRSQGTAEGQSYNLVTPNTIADTVFIDTDLNTEEFPFSYRIELYVPTITTLPVDTSSHASTVRLTTTSQSNQITLNWEANTPWYNYTQNFPYHLIYRSDNSSQNFILIDSINVNENGFTYVDKGTYGNSALLGHTDYFYKVLTRGSYGNPKIQHPLENFSQINSNRLLDIIPPCPPIAKLDKVDCRTLPCSGGNYSNTILWDKQPDDCANDITGYSIYSSDEENGDYTLLSTVSENSFIHTNLVSQAKCYKIKAFDYAGNESDFSNVVCRDNCPYFELPNVFTPGIKDDLNDFFSAFTATSKDTIKCARFVVSIDISIYDRWGSEVYSKKSITPEQNYLLWDGVTTSGKDASSGVYFYSVKVLFDVRDPDQRNKHYKGWVRVMH